MLISGLFILLFISAVSFKRINGIIINRAAALVLLYSFIISIDTLNVSIIGSGIGVYGGLYQVTVLSKIVEGFIYIIGAMILSNTMIIDSSIINLNNKISVRSEYSIIALFTVIGGILLITSNDLVSMYLSIELQSFGLYVLATIYRDSQAATYAGLKYFLLGGLSSGFILLGSSIVYAYTGVTNLESIYLLISEGSSINLFTNTTASLKENAIELSSFDLKFNSFVQLGLLVMTIGFLFKVASAPFHNWAADVYDGVPVKVTTWLAIMAKISILTFLLDLVLATSNLKETSFAVITDLVEKEEISVINLTNLILIASLLSLLVGTIVGLAQSRIKRLLAYSTISHVGFLLLAIAINTQDSTESFIFYLIQYSLTSANAFFVLIAFGSLSMSSNNQLKGFLKRNQSLSLDDNNAEKEYSAIQFISQLRGQFNAAEPSPLLALSMAIILFSMAGIPPLVGFFAKQAVLLAAVKNGYIFLSLIGIITSVISAAYYLRVIKVMVFEEHLEIENNSTAIKKSLDNNKTRSNLETATASHRYRLSNSLSFSISILTVLTLLFVLKPTLILNSAHIMALSLFYL